MHVKCIMQFLKGAAIILNQLTHVYVAAQCCAPMWVAFSSIPLPSQLALILVWGAI